MNDNMNASTMYSAKESHHAGKGVSRSSAMATREALLSSQVSPDPKRKRSQQEKFDQTTRLLHDYKGSENASINANFNSIVGYYEEVKTQVQEYNQSVAILKEELHEVQEFSLEKNEEIEQMMPPEYQKFNLHLRNFFAAQQAENFKLQKQITQLVKEKAELEEEIEKAKHRIVELDGVVVGEGEEREQNVWRNMDLERDKPFTATTHIKNPLSEV